MSTLFYKRLRKEIQLYKKDNFSFSNLILKPIDNNLCIWYAVIHDLKDTEYAGGVYLMKIMVPDKYPLSPPDIMMLTPSGRFDINKKLCTSFTGYHKDLYSASWNISSMCCGFISFLTDNFDHAESKGIGGISSTPEYKKQIAKESRNYIKNNKVVFDIFETYFKEYYDILGLN